MKRGEATDEFCVWPGMQPYPYALIYPLSPPHAKRGHSLARNLVVAGDPPVVPGEVAPLRLPGYQVAPVRKGMDAEA